MENKENARPYGASNGSAGTSHDDDDSDSNDGPILYRDDPPQPDRAAKIARKESLSLKLALRPDRQELINRNILRLQAENDAELKESKEAIGARLIRRLSMRPTAEELVERNILKSNKIKIKISKLLLNFFIYFLSSNARRTKEIQRGEEELPAAQAELPSDGRRAEGEENYSL